MERQNHSGKPILGRILRLTVKTLLLTILAVVLAVYGTVTCVVSLLSPDRLTPIVCKVANSVLDANVEISKVELFTKSSYPFLRIEVDTLTITTPKIAALKNDSSLSLPSYADTLLTIDRFVGELKIPSLMTGMIDINDVAVVGAGVNVVIVNDSVNNFDIVKQTSDDDDSNTSLPKIALHKFSIDGAKEFRFYDAMTHTSATVGIKAVLERDGGKPAYALTFSGDFAGDMLHAYNLLHLPMTLDGDVIWSYDKPKSLTLDDFTLGIDDVSFRFSTAVDFGDELVIRNFEGSSNGIRVNDILALLPESVKTASELQSLKTDAEIKFAMRLDSAFNIDRDSIPYATINLDISPCHLTFGRARIERLSAAVESELKGNDIDAAVFRIEHLELVGPATSLDINGEISAVVSDPLFDVRIDGFTSLAKLPPPLMKHIAGYISGKVKTELSVAGRISMFDKNNFHKLHVNGDIDCSKFYWLASDTANMVFVNDACLKFGTNMRFGQTQDLLAAVFKADSANILSGGIDLTVKDLSLGIGAQKMPPTKDTTIVVPMGGGLKLSSLNVTSITDSAGARFRDVAGKIVMKRFRDMKRVPEFLFDMNIKRMAAGSKDARMLFSSSQLHFNAHKLPMKKSMVRLRKTIDSIKRVRPELSPDSVIALAIARRRSHHSPHKRVHAEMTDSATEIIDWGTSKALGKLLLDWDINGTLTTDRARLFTPHFPLRNRLDNFSVSFNNDSILLHKIAYKVGRSDFLADGRISNVKRGLTARKVLSPIKIELDAASDTVDVNQIAEGFFRGAAFSKHHTLSISDLDVVDSESMFDKELNRDSNQKIDTMAPILLPANIEADIRLRANNVMYSDLMLHNMAGNILLYDGALNLHQLQASSDIGSVDLSALYSAPTADDMRFGFGLNVNRFDISRFVDMVPAVDSIMPLLRDISGIIDADIAATVDIQPDMTLDLPSLTAAIKLQGDSLQLLDADTFKTIARWLLFKDRQKNIIDHMTVEMIISDNQMQLFPFIFDIDRYKIGVQGHNDLALNFNYLISVLKSPLPFKFGITIKGNPEHYKIRLGRAKFNEKQAIERQFVVDTARVNLIDQIENVFKRGVRRSKFAKLKLPASVATAADINLEDDPVSAADSLLFIKEGLIPAPVQTDTIVKNKKKK
ncbi:MAG: hypothetical protein K2J12_03295 [Muribaculaceae bacterium]|nr:hypothetical protein [Muribaculaceae bacterium]